MIATALLPFVFTLADGALRAAKVFVCADPQTGALSVNEPEVRRAKQLDASLWQLTYSGGRKAVIEVNPAHRCQVVK